MAQVWVSAGLRGACFGRSESRELASNHGVDFRRARAKQNDGSPHQTNDQYFFLRVLLCITVHTSETSHVTTASLMEAFPFVAATNDASACVRVCVSVCHRTYQGV